MYLQDYLEFLNNHERAGALTQFIASEIMEATQERTPAVRTDIATFRSVWHSDYYKMEVVRDCLPGRE